MRNLDLPGRSTVHAVNGMAATSHPLSSIAAINVLQSGGNAMDAAVTASAVQCVVEPQSTGIGGDCFCLYAPAGGGLVAFNGSGAAPMRAEQSWFAEQGIDRIGLTSPHSVTVPGAIDAWDRLLSDHGTIGLDVALAPAIRHARDGYPVHHRVNHDFHDAAEKLRRDPAAAAIFLPGGEVPGIGTRHRQPELADTLQAIVDKGRDAFYFGAVAEDIVSHLNGFGGLHQLDDFAQHKGEYVDPISTGYRGYQVYECPPNGQGIVALQMLNILDGLGLDQMEPLSVERLHLQIEAARLAYRDRDSLLADPRMADLPIEKWLSEDRAAKYRSRIDRNRAMGPLPSDFPDHRSTVYITVVDRDLNAVSFINSTFWKFGSGLVAPRSGVVLQNRGAGFVLEPGHPNCIAPGKRPLHTIIPGMLMRNGQAVMPFGVMGGQYQPCGHVHLLHNLFEYGMDLQEAIDCPRLFPTTTGPVNVETGISPETRAGLEALGHRLAPVESPIGGGQAIWIDRENGVLRGASDPRKDGMAIGY